MLLTIWFHRTCEELPFPGNYEKTFKGTAAGWRTPPPKRGHPRSAMLASLHPLAANSKNGKGEREGGRKSQGE